MRSNLVALFCTVALWFPVALVNAQSNSAESNSAESSSTQVSSLPPEHVSTFRIINDYAETENEIGVLSVPRFSLLLDYVRSNHEYKAGRSINWELSGLYYANASDERKQMRSEVVAKLRELECTAATSLASEIAQQPLLQKIDITMSYHALQLGAVSNPKLPGNYVLHIAAQDRSYRQWTASGLQRLPFVPRTKVQQVAESVVEADCASSRWVWVITGTEAVKMVAGNWDQSRVNAPVGALYAPYFKGLSAAENAQLASELFEIGSFVQ